MSFLLVDVEVRYCFCFCFFLLKIVITVMAVKGNATWKCLLFGCSTCFHQEGFGGLVFLLGLQWYKIVMLCHLNFPMFCWVWQLLLCRSQGQLLCPSWGQEQVSPTLLSALSWWKSGLSSEHWWAFGRCQTTVIQDTFHLAHFCLLCHFGFIIHTQGRVNGKTERRF